MPLMNVSFTELPKTNLVEGHRLIRIGNVYLPVGFGSSAPPQQDVMEFYRCSAVDTTNHTWSGYRLVVIDGEYEIETVITIGLSYTSIIPVVGKIYNRMVTVEAKVSMNDLVFDGLIFHEPLSKAVTVSKTGHAMTTHSSVTYTTLQGIPCANFTGVGGIACNVNLLSDVDRSLSIWTYCTGGLGNWILAMLHGNDTTAGNFGIYKGDHNNLAWSTSGFSVTSNIPASNTWHHVVVTWSYTSGTIKVYVDGVLTGSSSATFHVKTSLLRIGTDWIGYLAGARIYDRELQASEVVTLFSEFTPTT